MDNASLARIAYYFDFDFADGRDVHAYVSPVLAAIETWRTCHPTATLRYFDREDGTLLITDTRPDAVSFQHRLTGWRRAAYLFCDQGRSLEEIETALASDPTMAGRHRDEPLLSVLDRWREERLIAHVDDRWLALALCSGR